MCQKLVNVLLAAFLMAIFSACGAESKMAPGEKEQETSQGEKSETEDVEGTPVQLSLVSEKMFVSGEYLEATLVVAVPSGGAYLASEYSVVRLKPWMSVHGHGSSERKLKITPLAEEPLEDGAPSIQKYRIEGLFFVMAGPWEIQVELKDGAGRVFAKEISLEVE